MGAVRNSHVAGAGRTAHGLLRVATGHGLRLIGRRTPLERWPLYPVKAAMSAVKGDVAKVRPAYGLLAVATGHGLRLIGRRTPLEQWPLYPVKAAMSTIKGDSVAKVPHQLHPEQHGYKEPMPHGRAKAAMSSLAKLLAAQAHGPLVLAGSHSLLGVSRGRPCKWQRQCIGCPEHQPGCRAKAARVATTQSMFAGGRATSEWDWSHRRLPGRALSQMCKVFSCGPAMLFGRPWRH